MNSLRPSRRFVSCRPNRVALCCGGFTLIELLVVLAVVALLGLVLSPALMASRPNTFAWQCLNNHRQLCNAWRMYSDDSRGAIVFASTAGTASTLNQYAWAEDYIDYNPSNPGNWDVSHDLAKRPLWPYSGNNAQIYRCPADTSYVILATGEKKPRVRTYSMNLYLGGFAGASGGYSQINPYKIFLKFSDIGSSVLGAANAFVFIDGRPDFLLWSNFFTDMTGWPNNPAQYRMGDFPGFLHHRSATVSFSDGHGETHRWLDSRTVPPPFLGTSGPYYTPRNADVAWLQDHATRPK